MGARRGHRAVAADQHVAPAGRVLARSHRQIDRALYRRPLQPSLHRPGHRAVPSGGDRALCGAALRALFDAEPGNRGLHPEQQHRRHAQSPVHDAPPLSRRASRQARHHGRIRHAQHRHRGGLPHHHAQGPDRHAAVSQAARQLLSPLQGARFPQHRVRLPHLGHARDRPQSGRGLRDRDRRDQAPPRPQDLVPL